MLLSIITIYPPPGDNPKIIEVLESVQRVILTKANCLGSLLMVEALTAKTICYMEQWRTREALDNHLRSTLYCRVLEAMELSSLPPTVEFYGITYIGGMDLIERVRLYPLNTDNDMWL